MLGTYHGTYQYSSSEPEGKKTAFQMEITQFDGETFSGTVEDDLESGGTRGTGTIKGKFSNGEITFEKQMPVLTVFLKDGKKEVPRKHAPIYYKGKLNAAGVFEGKWRIKARILFSRHIIGMGLGVSGTWEMRLESETGA